MEDGWLLAIGGWLAAQQWPLHVWGGDARLFADGDHRSTARQPPCSTAHSLHERVPLAEKTGRMEEAVARCSNVHDSTIRCLPVMEPLLAAEEDDQLLARKGAHKASAARAQGGCSPEGEAARPPLCFAVLMDAYPGMLATGDLHTHEHLDGLQALGHANY
ncbi:hypothetical protein Dimus_029916, partial [Dionaea muscipula]